LRNLYFQFSFVFFADFSWNVSRFGQSAENTEENSKNCVLKTFPKIS